MLVARGACSFAEKAAMLQAANVSLAIVYNNAPGASIPSSWCCFPGEHFAACCPGSARKTEFLLYHSVTQTWKKVFL